MKEEQPQVDVGESLGRIEAKLDAAISTLVDHEERIRIGETLRNKMLGAAATVGGAISLIGWWIHGKNN